MQPRFPAQNTQEWFDFIERRILDSAVDNDRQWRHLRQANAIVTGLGNITKISNSVIPIGSGSGIGTGTGFGSGSGNRKGTCCYWDGTFNNCLQDVTSSQCSDLHYVDPDHPGPCWAEARTCLTILDLCPNCFGTGTGSGSGSGSGFGSGGGCPQCANDSITFTYAGIVSTTCGYNGGNTSASVTLTRSSGCLYGGSFSFVGGIASVSMFKVDPLSSDMYIAFSYPCSFGEIAITYKSTNFTGCHGTFIFFSSSGPISSGTSSFSV